MDPFPSSVGVRGMLFFLGLARAAMDTGWRAEEDCEQSSMVSRFPGDWSSHVLVLPCLVMTRGEEGRSMEGWLNFLFGNGCSLLLLLAVCGMSFGVLESIVISFGLTVGGVASLRKGLFPVGVAG